MTDGCLRHKNNRGLTLLLACVPNDVVIVVNQNDAFGHHCSLLLVCARKDVIFDLQTNEMSGNSQMACEPCWMLT